MQEISTELLMALNPYIESLTNIYNTEQHITSLDDSQVDPAVKEAKKYCIHWIRDNQGQITFKLDKDDKEDDVWICKACGHRLNMKFNEEAVKTLMDAIQVIDGLVFMGPQHNLPASEMMPLITMKAALFRVATIQKAFNNYIKKQQSANAATESLTAGYETPERYTSITGYTS